MDPKYYVEKVFLCLDRLPPNYNLRDRLLATGATNLVSIGVSTGAIVTLRGRGSGFIEPNTGQESLEPLHVKIQHTSMEMLQAAKQMVQSLVAVVQRECALTASSPSFQPDVSGDKIILNPPTPELSKSSTELSSAPQYSKTVQDNNRKEPALSKDVEEMNLSLAIKQLEEFIKERSEEDKKPPDHVRKVNFPLTSDDCQQRQASLGCNNAIVQSELVLTANSSSNPMCQVIRSDGSLIPGRRCHEQSRGDASRPFGALQRSTINSLTSCEKEFTEQDSPDNLNLNVQKPRDLPQKDFAWNDLQRNQMKNSGTGESSGCVTVYTPKQEGKGGKRKSRSRLPNLPELGQPGGLDDPLRRGLSGAGVRWYLRFLEKGLSPEVARQKAMKRKVSQEQAHPVPCKRGTDDTRPSQWDYPKTKKTFTDSSTSVTRPGTSHGGAFDSIEVAILPKAPGATLSKDDLTSIEEAIVAEIIKGAKCKIMFNGIRFRMNMLILECVDYPTANWVKEKAPRLSNWRGVDLRACDADDIPKQERRYHYPSPKYSAERGRTRYF